MQSFAKLLVLRKQRGERFGRKVSDLERSRGEHEGGSSAVFAHVGVLLYVGLSPPVSVDIKVRPNPQHSNPSTFYTFLWGERANDHRCCSNSVVVISHIRLFYNVCHQFVHRTRAFTLSTRDACSSADCSARTFVMVLTEKCLNVMMFCHCLSNIQ